MDLLARLAEDPQRAAVLLDVDGTLAPIVPRPEDARVPPETQAELRRLRERYALVACISGRGGADARRVVGVPELVYVGNHGLELEPDAHAWEQRLHDFLRTAEWTDIEDKGLSAALHFRNAPNEAEARVILETIAERAHIEGLETRFGRKVLEILPPVRANKGTAVLRLVQQHDLHRALYAGDDTTDLNAFAALDELELGVRIAVASPEGPPALADGADIVVKGPTGLLDALRGL